MISLISEINESYYVCIPVDQIVAENFNSTHALYALIERLLD